MSDQDSNKVEPQTEDSSDNKPEESSALIEASSVEDKLDEFIDAIPVPPEKKEIARSELRELFFGLIDRSGAPSLSPEVAKILAASADKDNDNKFQFLIQKQKDQAEADKRADALRDREHDLKCIKHGHNFKIVLPTIIVVLLLVIGCTVAGIYFCANGFEALGASVLTGTWMAVFGYMAGLGTSNFFKEK